MTRRPRSTPTTCTRCGEGYVEGDEGWTRLKAGWFCTACRAIQSAELRKVRGAKQLDRAAVTTTVRDGREFTVKVLPSRR